MPLPPPPGCLETPGFILTAGTGWLTQRGDYTNQWRERGVWATQEEAQEVIAKLNEIPA